MYSNDFCIKCNHIKCDDCSCDIENKELERNDNIILEIIDGEKYLMSVDFLITHLEEDGEILELFGSYNKDTRKKYFNSFKEDILQNEGVEEWNKLYKKYYPSCS